jgi:hypothetical protein
LPRNLDLGRTARRQRPGVSAYQLRSAAGLSALHMDVKWHMDRARHSNRQCALKHAGEAANM